MIEISLKWWLGSCQFELWRVKTEGGVRLVCSTWTLKTRSNIIACLEFLCITLFRTVALTFPRET